MHENATISKKISLGKKVNKLQKSRQNNCEKFTPYIQSDPPPFQFMLIVFLRNLLQFIHSFIALEGPNQDTVL